MKETLYNLSDRHSFDRLGSSNSPVDGFSELEIGRESVSFSRTYLKYRRPLTLIDTQIFTPELDALSLLELSSASDNLFTSLVKAGLGSKLINHFAACERSNSSYTDLEVDDVLIERVFRHKNKDRKANHSENGLGSEKFYRLKHSMRSFLRIVELDKNFIANIVKGIESGFCKLARVDLCIDLSEDIMPYVTHGIETGQYRSFRRHPYAYGWLAGQRLEGPVGRDSKLSEEFNNKKLVLDTVYFGDSRKSNEVVVFYNKREERKSNAESRWAPKSRIEVRLYPRKKDIEKVAILILKSYLDEKDGWRKRIPYFGDVLCGCVSFTTMKRPPKATDINDSAPWWESLICALKAGSKSLQFPTEKSLLNPKLTQAELPGALPITEKPKKRKGRPKGSKDKKTRKPGSGRKKKCK